MKIRELYKEKSIEISPLLAGLLSECDRIQAIQNRLWAAVENEPLITEYTNKRGATNMTASAALKELRSWEIVFQGACRSIFKIIRSDISDIDDLDDGLSEYI